MATRSVEFRPHFGAFVLESLTLGMYGESHNALREYIQNGFDSLRTAVRDRLIRSDEARIEVTLAAAIESCPKRSSRLARFASMWSSASKSRTSAALRLRQRSGSKRVTVSTAERRARSPAQRPSAVVPMGVTGPSPVTTTRRRGM